MEAFFQNIIELIKIGDWSGVLASVLSITGIAVASVGGVGGIIAIISKFFTNGKFLSKFKDFITNKIVELQTKVLEYKTNAETQLKDYAEKFNEATQKIAELKSNLEDMLEQQQAFYTVILNNELLKTQFNNALKEIQLAKTKSIEAVQQVETASETVQEAVTTAVEVVETESKKHKIKLRKKEE